MIVYSTVNASLKDPISEEELADILRTGKFGEDSAPYVNAFFTDVPVQDIVRFAREYKIPLEHLKDYYEKNIP